MTIRLVRVGTVLMYVSLLLVCGGLASAAALQENDPWFQSPEGKEWLSENVGIITSAEIAGVKGFFDQWAGFIDGKLVIISAGYEFSDPSIGEIFVSDGTTSSGIKFEIPNHVGPVAITRVQNGVATLATVPGRYERSGDNVSDQDKFLQVSTIQKFYFDLRRNQFVTQ